MQNKRTEIWATLSGLLGGFSLILVPLMVLASMNFIWSLPELRIRMVYLPLLYTTILPVSIIAVTSGIIALKKIRNAPQLKGKGMALTGIILGLLFPLIMYIIIKLI